MGHFLVRVACDGATVLSSQAGERRGEVSRYARNDGAGGRAGWGLGVEADAANAPTVLRICAQDTSCSKWISERRGAAGFAEGFRRKLV